MWGFIISGALYLIGVAVSLVVKPSFMFTPDGAWKEFGIGQDEKRYTVFPFWLFCLVWAVLAYVIVLTVLPLIIGEDEAPINNSPYKSKNNANVKRMTKKSNVIEEDNSDLLFDDELEGEPTGLKKGYYVLNKKASRLSGTAKYVYIGEEVPDN